MPLGFGVRLTHGRVDLLPFGEYQSALFAEA